MAQERHAPASELLRTVRVDELPRLLALCLRRLALLREQFLAATTDAERWALERDRQATLDAAVLVSRGIGQAPSVRRN